MITVFLHGRLLDPSVKGLTGLYCHSIDSQVMKSNLKNGSKILVIDDVW